MAQAHHLNASVHSYGGIVFHDVIKQTFAHKAIEKDADGSRRVIASSELQPQQC